MVVLRPTRKLQKLLPVETDGEQRSDGALGDWYVNRFVVDRRPLLMIVSSASLLAAVEPARDIRTLPERLGAIVADRLYWLGVDQKVIDAEVFTMRTPWHASKRDVVFPQKKALELLNARWESLHKTATE
jgi:hypothetical protein